MELMSRAASVTRDALTDVPEGGGDGGSGDSISSRDRRSSEPTSPAAASAGAAAFRLGGGRGGGGAAPVGAQRLCFVAGERRIVLEGRPGSGAGQLIITAARNEPRPAAATDGDGDNDAGTRQRLPGSPAAMLAHWTIGSPSGDTAGQ